MVDRYVGVGIWFSFPLHVSAVALQANVFSVYLGTDAGLKEEVTNTFFFK